jgi:multiple sugar transport system ATP-binding protein
MNLLTGSVDEEGGKLVFRHTAFKLPLGEALRTRIEPNRKVGEVVLGIRPTEIHLADRSSEQEVHSGTAYIYEPFGKYAILSVRLGEDIIKVKTPQLKSYHQGEGVRLYFEGSALVVFDPQTGRVI